ncbi:MAG: hypothetical protein M3Y72_05800, partial [Acidobacteriota bacterium]|nr:hypothetical protein [Acidobacteriota bacterium]
HKQGETARKQGCPKKVMLKSALACVLLSAIGCNLKRKHSEGNPNQSSVAQSQLAARTSFARAAGDSSDGAEDEPGSYTVIHARHVVFLENSGLRLRTEWLEGRMYPTKPGVMPSLDDPTSFKVEVENGQVKISMRVLSAVLSAGPLKNSRLSDIRISAPGAQEIQINATLHKFARLPIQLNGGVETTGDGRIAIHIQKLKVLKLPVKGLLHVLDLKPAELAHLQATNGTEMHGDTIYIRPDLLLPPPRQLGKLKAVRFTPDGDLEEEYGHGTSDMRAENFGSNGEWRNFLRLTGGTVRFGKLTMQNTDLVLIDTSPGDWFEFDLARYKDQLASGHMRMAANGGLEAFIPDARKIQKAKEILTTSPSAK